MAKKLYEFSGLLNYHLVIAANSQAEAQKEAERYEELWKNGQFVEVSDIQLIEVRKPSSKDLRDEAHIVI